MTVPRTATCRYWRGIYVFLSVFISLTAHGQNNLTEESPSRAQYFSWINNTNEGATEAQTLTNLEFFAWLKAEYGMQLDIYAFDAGAIDGKRFYGSTDSERFKQQFPNGFDPMYERAKELGIRLGVWGGPDGFGDTPEEEQRRTDMMVELCDKYDFALFKFDAVSGRLRDEKQAAFANMMTRCREHAPDLILLNHRLNLGEIGTPHATTFLFEGKETYTDVFSVNEVPAPHHRADGLSRGLTPELTRLTEDHGTCIGPSLDHWDDELVLQAFNRSLILSPQMYCNPWLLRDDEFPKLARIFNIAREYRDLIPMGKVLPEDRYGPYAVSRGDGSTRLITLRNLNWTPVKYELRLDDELGLESGGSRRSKCVVCTPEKKCWASIGYNDTVSVTVEPFRSALIRVTRRQDFAVVGTAYEVVRDVAGRPLEIDLLGAPGTGAEISFKNAGQFSSASIDGKSVGIAGSNVLKFNGTALTQDPRRHLGEMQSVELPEDAAALYEATVFSADSNALEVRSFYRSGESQVPQVRAARDAFFTQDLFVDRGIWDRNLFDGDSNTAFFRNQRWFFHWSPYKDLSIEAGTLRLDLGSVQAVDTITLHSRDEASIAPLKIAEGMVGEVSTDLKTWHEVHFLAATTMEIEMSEKGFPVRYFRMSEAPLWLSEITARHKGKDLDRNGWRASNLFGYYDTMQFTHAWQLDTTLDEIAPDAYLAVGVPGEYGAESVYAALRVDGQLIGAPDRAPAYPANSWEFPVQRVEGNYTYYIPLDSDWAGKRLEIVLLGRESASEILPSVWLWREAKPLATKRLVLERQTTARK